MDKLVLTYQLWYRNKGSEVVTYKAMTPQCGRSVVQVLVVRVDIGVMTYEKCIPFLQVIGLSNQPLVPSGSGLGCQII